MPPKRSVNNQTEFPFIGQILHDKTWWTRLHLQPLMIKPRTPQATTPPSTVVLISCSKSKLAKKAPARDLYTGRLFRKAVSWAEKQGYNWYVVSALYGLVHPDHSLEPYDFTLKQLRVRERESWAHMVVAAELTKHVSKAVMQFSSCLNSTGAILKLNFVRRPLPLRIQSSTWLSVSKSNGSQPPTLALKGC